MKILIADDSEFMRTILKSIVSKTNIKDAEILEAADGNEVINLLKNEKLDLILLDIIMPNKDGMSVLKEYGTAASTVVIVSSVDQETVINEAMSLGVKNYITKPFEEKEVINVINSLFPAVTPS